MAGYRHALDGRARALVERVNRINRASSGDRADLRRSLRLTPEDPQTRRSHRIVAPYLPQNPDPATERAFYAIAAMIAAQPRAARDQDDQADTTEADTTEADTTEADTTEADTINLSEGGSDAQVASGDQLAAVHGPTGIGDDAESEATGTGRRSGWVDVRQALGLSLGASLAQAVSANQLNADTTASRLQLLCRQGIHGVHRQLPRLVLQIREKKVDIAWERLLVDLAEWDTSRDRVTKRWLQDYYRTLHHLERNNTATPESDSEGTNRP
ncbi:type I-E CRISPR-associated protein Cse2/CasB [Nocardia sp. PE-7]|uniref:type I-E CRISPR-associated protein Cse2/CasB n=1 Tax=Nocardia sp. PE-7 TaxID=3058426 RepID=UPI00265A9A8C|nr:type I-E CRISPR-associated protein Cse2/CasB [Nocardia sp. PE-7]WKG08907.1 type I-E CRISPR-associated protein Cse2/CasB [Nocardia sp. PE-7]